MINFTSFSPQFSLIKVHKEDLKKYQGVGVGVGGGGRCGEGWWGWVGGGGDQGGGGGEQGGGGGEWKVGILSSTA